MLLYIPKVTYVPVPSAQVSFSGHCELDRPFYAIESVIDLLNCIEFCKFFVFFCVTQLLRHLLTDILQTSPHDVAVD